ncbi:hypothetical protein L873DRAFT_1796525 [Choiromyces venosus 120613-1]|uniref:Uncharacterized protein n=1 Tax=Choiromyces venosus 120613-1 TaxID=1336337 RepID=A0A3N4IRV7_9PEZI|nr:hypothetical protein L873DRAFT_1796525 [Choiromyces venosus 120613-1]
MDYPPPLPARRPKKLHKEPKARLTIHPAARIPPRGSAINTPPNIFQDQTYHQLPQQSNKCRKQDRGPREYLPQCPPRARMQQNLLCPTSKIAPAEDIRPRIDALLPGFRTSLQKIFGDQAVNTIPDSQPTADIAMSLGNSQNSDGTGIGDSQHATISQELPRRVYLSSPITSFAKTQEIPGTDTRNNTPEKNKYNPNTQKGKRKGKSSQNPWQPWQYPYTTHPDRRGWRNHPRPEHP